MTLKDISLRERKYAQTKVDLLRTMLEKTNDRRLDDVSIKELCENALISEATFFNYFPKKSDLLIYFIKMWTVQVNYMAEAKYGNTSGLKKIELVFDATGRMETIGNMRIMSEIIAFQAHETIAIEVPVDDITAAEKIIAFPEHEGIDEMKISCFRDLFVNNLKLAIKIGELPEKINIDLLMLNLGSIFFGVPLMMGNKHAADIHSIYAMQLQFLWESQRRLIM